MAFNETTIESEIIYEGAILNLRKDKVNTKNGGTSYREIVEHNGGSVVVPITEDGKVVLVRQFRKAVEKTVLEVPAGKIEIGEDPFTTVKRELREETGYTAENIEFMIKMYPTIGYSTEILYFYIAWGLTPGETNFDDSEDIEVVEMDLEEAYEMVVSGEIEDGKTIAALLVAREKVKEIL